MPKSRQELLAEIKVLNNQLLILKLEAKRKTPPESYPDRFYFFFGQILSDARRLYGMTQEDLADKLRLTRTSLANMEAGKQRCPMHKWHEAFEELNMTLADAYAEWIKREKKYSA